jgi:hypothetical protein
MNENRRFCHDLYFILFYFSAFPGKMVIHKTKKLFSFSFKNQTQKSAFTHLKSIINHVQTEHK